MADSFKPLTPRVTARRRIVEQVSAERWPNIGADIIAKFKNPWDCEAHLLPFLAFEESVDIWNELWPEWKKRSVIASAKADHAIKTTEAGIRRYVEIADAEVLQIVTPPEGFFAAPNLSKEEKDAYIRKHPKVRITFARGTGVSLNGDGIFADISFVEAAFVGIDNAPALHGRRAYLVQNGVSTPLQLSRLVTETETRQAVEIERVVVPGKSVAMSFVGQIGADIGFADAWDDPPRAFTFVLDRTYQHSDTRLELSMLEVGYQPRDVRYERESETGEAGEDFVADASFAEIQFVGEDKAKELLADVLYLYDPSIPSPILAGGSFADVNRVDMGHHRAEMLIDWQMTASPKDAFFCDMSFAEYAYAYPVDTTRRDFLLSAVAASQRLSDRIGVTFKTHRARTWADGIPLDGSARLGEPVRNVL
jgi:hypothetical protein